MKSIIIVGKDKDIAVNSVIDWLVYHHGVNVFRITRDCDLSFELIDITRIQECVLSNKYEHKVTIGDVIGLFIHGKCAVKKSVNSVDNSIIAEAISYHISQDYSAILQALISDLGENADINKIGSPIDDKSVKLKQLLEARKIGLNVPETYVVANMRDLKLILSSGKNYITKSFDLSPYIETDEIIVSGQRTEVVSQESLNDVDDFFLASCIQNEITKKYEVRTFFFENNFYSMAIFSQSNQSTKLDYRNFNSGQQNRQVPYILPESIEQKIIKLASKLGVTCGSVDIIVTPEGEHVFLELNPCGQFVQLGINCNYQIEKHISNYLVNGKVERV